MKTYSGIISYLEPNQIFVFGSNTQGRHGKGAAKWALDNAGAIYGQASGLQGQSFAIVTKDLTKPIHPSIDRDKIVWQIRSLYLFAQTIFGKDYEFIIAYSGIGINLNGYTPYQMAEMFTEAGFDKKEQSVMIPANIVFEKVFFEMINSHSIGKIG